MGDIIADGTVESSTYGRNKIARALSTQLDPFPDRIQQALRQRTFEASRSTLQRLVGDVMESLEVATVEGMGVRESADLLRDQFKGMSEFELRRIARTELNRAQQIASVETEKELNVAYHEWITSRDARVRDSHLSQHGEIVRVGDQFSNGLTHPGDPNGPASEFINCRCSIVPFIVPPGMMFPQDQARFRESDLREVAA